jgi:hypothetical protein
MNAGVASESQTWSPSTTTRIGGTGLTCGTVENGFRVWAGVRT